MLTVLKKIKYMILYDFQLLIKEKLSHNTDFCCMYETQQTSCLLMVPNKQRKIMKRAGRIMVSNTHIRVKSSLYYRHVESSLASRSRHIQHKSTSIPKNLNNVIGNCVQRKKRKFSATIVQKSQTPSSDIVPVKPPCITFNLREIGPNSELVSSCRWIK